MTPSTPICCAGVSLYAIVLGRRRLRDQAARSSSPRRSVAVTGVEGPGLRLLSSLATRAVSFDARAAFFLGCRRPCGVGILWVPSAHAAPNAIARDRRIALALTWVVRRPFLGRLVPIARLLVHASAGADSSAIAGALDRADRHCRRAPCCSSRIHRPLGVLCRPG